MFDALYAYALVAGMVATVNPCGFALLPAYLAAFVGLDERAGRSGWVGRFGSVGRAVAVAAVLSAGFATVFGVFGAVISKLIGSAKDYLPWVTIVVGVAMIVLSAYLLTGRSLTLSIPKLARGGADGTYWSMYLFGVSYALASLTCTFGPFLSATSVAFSRGSYVSTVAVFLAYALGMGVIVGVLTVAVALAKAGIVHRFRALLPVINRIAGALVLLAGLYSAYYGWYEVRLRDASFDGRDPVIDVALDVQQWLLGLMPTQREAVWWTLAAVTALAAFVAWRLRSGAKHVEPDEPLRPATREPA